MTSVPIEQLSVDLRIACMRLTRQVRTESKDLLPPHLYSVLIELTKGPLTITELAERERVASPVMTRNVNALERSGFVRREPDPDDGRRSFVSMTDAGREIREIVHRNRDEWMARRLRELAPDELTLLASATVLLQRIEAMDRES